MFEESYFESTIRWHLYRRWKKKKNRIKVLERLFYDALSNNINGIFIDAGANVGDLTAAARGRGLSVIAFEPDRTALLRLKSRFEKDPKVKIIPKAIGANSRVATFYQPTNTEDDILRTQCSSLMDNVYNGDVNSYPVEVVDICAFIKALDRPVGVLKMDIEGAEIECLNALIDNGFHEKIGYMLVETHERLSLNLLQQTNALKAKIKEKNIRNINLEWI